ncbi:MAG: hypothetical protein ABI623_05175 [bacterium]
MRIRSLDTTREADRIQLEIFRKMKPGERLRRGFELSAAMKRLNATGVRMRHPNYSDDEIRLAVIRMRLGDELFLKVYPHASHVLP